MSITYGDPIPRPVVEEIAQLLGYEPRDVAWIVIDYRHVEVTTTAVVDHDVTDAVTRHTVV